MSARKICFHRHPDGTKGVCVECGGVFGSANDMQIGGNHYKDNEIQPWDYIVTNGLGFLDGNVVKYVTRYRKKGGVEDLRKAQHYLEKLIEVAEGR